MASREGHLSTEPSGRARAQEEREEGRQDTESLIHSLHGIVWEADARTFQFTFVSQQAESLLGYPLERWLTERTFWQDHIHPDDRDWAVAFCSKATAERRSDQFEYRMMASDGRTVWLRDIVTVIADRGEPVKLRGVMVDITEQKLAEALLKESQQQYQDLVDSLDAIVWEANAKDFRFRFVSKQCERLLGYTPEYWLKHLTWRNLIHPEDVDHVIATSARAVKQNRNHTLEFRMIAANGQIVWIKDITTVIAENGCAITLGGVFLDITERKRRDEALHLKTEQLQAITDTMMVFLRSGDWQRASAMILRSALKQTASEYGFVGVAVKDAAIRVLAFEEFNSTKASHEELREDTPKYAHGDGYFEFSTLDNLLGQVVTLGKTVLSNQPGADRPPTGLPTWLPPTNAFLGVPILKGEEVVGMIGVANRSGGYTGEEQGRIEILTHAAAVLYDDYIRRERESALQEQLRQSQKLESIGKLAGGVAHDFNNILTVIQGYASVVQLKADQAPDLVAASHQISVAAERAANLTRQLLTFSRRHPMQLRNLDLNGVVANMTRMLERIVGEDISLVVQASPTLPPIRADASMMEQVLLNLVVNAREAMPRGGRLIVRTDVRAIDPAYVEQNPEAARGQFVCLGVSDTGCGISPENLSRIFEPFFTTKDVGKGTGLGLATVYGIVKQHGGWINVETNLGKGTTFSVYLPASTEPLEKLLISGARRHGNDPGGGR
jgi:PAS domain S-box-containing protein